MNKSNKILIFILLINILIISVHSYSLKKYDYGKLFDVASGSDISKNYQVSRKQLLNFKLTKDKAESPAVFINITSEGLPEYVIFYGTFKDEIASEKNSNKSETITPLGLSMCMPNSFSFSIQMNNGFLGGDIDINIHSAPDSSHCYAHHAVKLLHETDNSPSDELLVIKEEFSQTSGTSKIISNGIFMFSIVILLILQL